MKDYYAEQVIEKCLQCEKSRNKLLDSLTDSLPYYFLLFVGMVTLIMMYNAKRDYDKRQKNKPNVKKIVSSIETLKEMQEEKEKQKQNIKNKLAQKEMSKEEWLEKNIETINSGYLEELQELLKAYDEILINPQIEEPEIVDGKSEDIESLEKSNEIKRKRFNQFAKKQPPLTIQAPLASDRTFTWDKELPGYNFTRKCSTDLTRPLHRLSSGNRFVFINKFLIAYLTLYYPEALLILDNICRHAKDGLANKSKGQRGFIVWKQQEDFYIKAKDPTVDVRFLGNQLATKAGMSIFSLNSVKFKHKSKKIMSFPDYEMAKISAKK